MYYYSQFYNQINTMDMYYPRRELVSPGIVLAYYFLKESHLNFIISCPNILSTVLNEYIFFMRKYYNMYLNRIKPEELKKPYSQDISEFHISNFNRIANRICIEHRDDKASCKEFYSQLLAFVDDNLNENFYYGKYFTDKEQNILIKAWRDSDIYMAECHYKQIKIMFDEKDFDRHKFDELIKEDRLYHDVDVITNKTKTKVIITIKNSTEDLLDLELWYIQSCGDIYMKLSIDYRKTTNKVLWLNARTDTMEYHID